jgi:hypothetical protein
MTEAALPALRALVHATQVQSQALGVILEQAINSGVPPRRQVLDRIAALQWDYEQLITLMMEIASEAHDERAAQMHSMADPVLTIEAAA